MKNVLPLIATSLISGAVYADVAIVSEEPRYVTVWQNECETREVLVDNSGTTGVIGGVVGGVLGHQVGGGKRVWS